MATDTPSTPRSTRWLARDLVELVDEKGLGTSPPGEDATADATPGYHFDVVIVGSGYGAAMVLQELAGYAGENGQTLQIAMLERGHEYLPGMFPSRMSDLPGHVRYNNKGQSDVRGRETGLFDLRVGPDVSMLVANGLGGGSLINAGVMEAPLASVFHHRRWPATIRNDETLSQQLAYVQTVLRAAPFTQGGARATAMDRLAGCGGSKPVSVTVAQVDDDAHGVKACNGCGDCATGCNFRAKLSLDATLIAEAVQRHPNDSMQVVTGATVRTFEPIAGGGYTLEVVHTEPNLRRRETRGFQIRTRFLVIAAGTLGSTELLLRTCTDKLKMSRSQLGQRFSSNGDMISAVYNMDAPAQAIADEDTPYAQRAIGPTITRMIDRRLDPSADCVLQDLAIPGPLRRLLQEIVTTGAAIESLTHFNRAGHDDASAPDAAGIDQEKTDRTMVVALIGTDDATGRLILPRQEPDSQVGTLAVSWKTFRRDPRLDAYQSVLERMGAAGHPGAIVIANPAWRPLPKSIASLLDGVNGTTLTTHPLGGCSMADDAAHGVVNAIGQVFRDSSGVAVHEDLVVLDGSVIPTALGINPALTIATLARRAIRQLRDDIWLFVPVAESTQNPFPPRPSFRVPPPPKKQPSTRIELNERMVARGAIMVDGKPIRCRLELRLQFQPQEVARLIDARSSHWVSLDPQRSVLRLMASPSEADILPMQPAPAAVDNPAVRPLLEIPLSGQMRMLQMAPSSPAWRTLVALFAWFRNRALRDMFGVLRFDGKSQTAANRVRALLRFFRSLPAWAWSALKLASHAGNRRELEYRFMLGQPSAGETSIQQLAARWAGSCIGATKMLTYEREGNPVNQFTFARISGLRQLEGLQVKSVLKVDYAYFAQIGVPLLRIESQANQPRALIDLASFGLYLARVVLPLHAWTFRLPDRPAPSKAVPLAANPARAAGNNPNAHRLPCLIPGLPEPEIVTLPTCDGHVFRLTRYRVGPTTRSTVLLIHGYSASGTTFAHRLLPYGGLAATLARAGHDAWVIDLRSSCGMITAQNDWRFEDMGCQDIPLAIQHIVQEAQVERIDVIAHCMGAAMLSLGLFGTFPTPTSAARSSPDQCPTVRKAMAQRINRIVFSQVGPAVVMSPTNTARAYVFSWLRHYFNLKAYRFLPERPDKTDDMLDRLLSLVPYPRVDFDRGNPFWRPWQRTAWVVPRHRMDALYGVTFNLPQMGDDVLNAIDDFFGPMHLNTAAQVIAFARNRLVTDRTGSSTTMVAGVIKATIPHCKVLCLHSEENVLADVSTRATLLRLLEQAELGGVSIRLQSFGHQDSLIGVRSGEVYDQIHEFLD